MIEHYLQIAQPYIEQYGYAAVFVAVMIEGFGILAPGQTLLFAAAVFAARGELNIVLVAALALVASIIGDNVAYVLGRYGGRRVLRRYGRFLGLRTRHLNKMERFVARHGARILLFARFVDVLRQTAGIGAGLGRLRWWRFAVFDAIGCSLWVAACCAAGFLLGDHLEAVVAGAKRHPAWLISGAAAILLVIGAFIAYRFHRRRLQSESSDI